MLYTCYMFCISRHVTGMLQVPSSRVTPAAAGPATPGQDLISWCQEAVSGHKGVRITNMTTSWRSGLAFCAVIHSFRPDLL